MKTLPRLQSLTVIPGLTGNLSRTLGCKNGLLCAVLQHMPPHEVVFNPPERGHRSNPWTYGLENPIQTRLSVH
jgi:hypothetical protein